MAQQAIEKANNALPYDVGTGVFQSYQPGTTTKKKITQVADATATNDAVNYGQFTVHDATISGWKEDTEDYKLETADWAQKVDGAVKVYADNSVTGSALGYSAKAWTIGGTDITDTASAGSAKQWAIGGGSSFTVGNKVDGSSGSYSAKYYSNAASTSATAASASETAAAASEASANASADAVASIIDNFYDKYLGAMADNATQGTNPTPTGTWIKNSSSITVSANTNIKVGQLVTGTGIPVGANVLSIDGTTVVISDNMDAAGTGVTLTFTGYGVYGTFNSTKDGPATDNDNGALADGMLYFNTTDDVMKVYDVTSTKWKQLQPTTSEMTAITTVSTNISDVNNFADIYQISDFTENSGTGPNVDGGGNARADGDLAFDSTANRMKVYDGS